MAGAGAHAAADRGADLGLHGGAVEKRDVLRPGRPTNTLRPASAAASSNHTGGTVKTRTVLTPAWRISAKSSATTSCSGNEAPWLPSPNGP
jgi:hypothetical protein